MNADLAQTPAAAAKGWRLGILTFATATGMLLAALDSNIVGTAMPSIAAALGGLDLYSWVFAGYALTSTTAMPLFGRLSDIYGRKRLYLGGMALFVAASAACGGAPTMIALIVARAVQGVGGAAIMALTFTIMADLYPPERRGQVQGVTSSAWALAAITGPAIGALLVTTLGWRWVFLVNLPISLVPILLLGKLLQEPPRSPGGRSVDVIGALTLSASVVSLMFAALLAGNQQSLTGLGPIGLALLSVALLAAFGWIQTRVPVPTIPLSLFRNRMFVWSAIGSLAFGWVAFCEAVFVPLFAQGVIGGSALSAGAVLLPNTLAWSIAASSCGPLIRPLGYRVISLVGFLVLAVGGIMLLLMGRNASLTQVAIAMVLAGIGSGMNSPTLLIAIQNAVDPRQLGVATSLAMFFRNIGYSIGVSIMGAVLAGGLAQRLGGAVADPGSLLVAGATSALSPALVVQFRTALTGAMHEVFLVSLIVTLFGVFAAFNMTGWREPDVAIPSIH